MEALKKAELVTRELPTLEEIPKQVEAKASKNKSLERARQLRLHKISFFIRACDAWIGKQEIHVTINRLQKKYNLRWLYTSMSHHRFNNLTEVFTGDLTSKLNKNIGLKDF